MGKQEDIRYFCSICAAHVRVGSSTDLNITHLYACPNRGPFSDWPGLWLEGSHRGMGELDWRWGASDEGWEEGEAVLGMARETWSTGVSLIHAGVSSPALEPGSFGCGGFFMLGGSAWHGPCLTWASWSWGALAGGMRRAGGVGWFWEFIIPLVLPS